MDRIYLENIRELDFVLKKYRNIFLQSSSILEIGAGSGWQARELASRGYDVQAIDIAASTYSAENVFPIQQYNGEHLPFADASFDIIFSSNVLDRLYRFGCGAAGSPILCSAKPGFGRRMPADNLSRISSSPWLFLEKSVGSQCPLSPHPLLRSEERRVGKE